MFVCENSGTFFFCQITEVVRINVLRLYIPSSSEEYKNIINDKYNTYLRAEILRGRDLSFEETKVSSQLWLAGCRIEHVTYYTQIAIYHV